MITIKSVKINNFRIYKKAEIDFESKQLILLTGSNGYGKTSLIDSIEWCITGDIKRLHEKFDSRYTNNLEKNRAENKKGILKNSECKKKDPVKVKLKLICNGEEISISRERLEDSLECNEEFNIEGNIENTKLKEELEKLRNEKSIYKYNFCDMNKTYRFMNLSRTDLKEQVRDFLHDRTNAEALTKKLEYKLKSIDEEFKKNELNLSDQVQKKNAKYSEKSKIVVLEDIKKYPELKAYDNEPSIIQSLQQAKKIQSIIRGWGYNFVCSKIIKLKRSKDAIKNKDILIDLKKKFDGNQLLIEKFIKKGLNNKEKRDGISNYIEDLRNKKEVLKKKFDADVSEYESYLVIKTRFENNKHKYNLLMKEIRLLERNIDSLGNGGKLVEAFTLMIESKDEIITEYRKKGNLNCPLCGSSETFETINLNNIAQNAKNYLQQHNEIQRTNFIVKQQKKDEANKIWIDFNQFASDWIESKISKLIEKNKVQSEEWNKVEVFFNLVKNNHIELCENMYSELEVKVKNQNKKILEHGDKLTMQKDAYKVLEYLKYTELFQIQSEDYSSLMAFIETLDKQTVNYNEFKYEVMINKLTYLSSYISSNAMLELDKEIEVINENIEKFKIKNNKLEKDKIILKEFNDSIGKKLKDLDQVEFDSVGPYLYKIFCKIIKHTNITGFQFKRDDSRKKLSGSGFLDDNKSNILNIFSEGQLGVFMISYFIGNILKRKNENVLGTFFMDDMTNCLDDINVLAFIDTLKYLLMDDSSGMKQLFFATCNDNISALLKNRIQGFGSSYKIVEFTAIGQVKNVNV